MEKIFIAYNSKKQASKQTNEKKKKKPYTHTQKVPVQILKAECDVRERHAKTCMLYHAEGAAGGRVPN